MNDELKDEKDKFLRLFAEFENFRKRTAKERLDLFKSASSELMTALIPVVFSATLGGIITALLNVTNNVPASNR